MKVVGNGGEMCNKMLVENHALTMYLCKQCPSLFVGLRWMCKLVVSCYMRDMNDWLIGISAHPTKVKAQNMVPPQASF